MAADIGGHAARGRDRGGRRQLQQIQWSVPMHNLPAAWALQTSRESAPRKPRAARMAKAEQTCVEPKCKIRLNAPTHKVSSECMGF